MDRKKEPNIPRTSDAQFSYEIEHKRRLERTEGLKRSIEDLRPKTREVLAMDLPPARPFLDEERVRRFERLQPDAKEVFHRAYEDTSSSAIKEAGRKAKNKLKDLGDELKMQTVDKSKLLFNEVLFKWNDWRSSRLEEKLLTTRAEREAAQYSMEQDDAALNKLRDEFGEIPAKAERKAQAERGRAHARIQDIEKRERALVDKIDARSMKRGRYERRGKDIASDAAARINEQLVPYEKKRSEFAAKRAEYAQEIDMFSRNHAELAEKADRLRDRIEKSRNATERKILKQTLKGINKNLAEVESSISKRRSGVKKINARAEYVEARARPWEISRDRFKRIDERAKEATSRTQESVRPMPKSTETIGTPDNRGESQLASSVVDIRSRGSNDNVKAPEVYATMNRRSAVEGQKENGGIQSRDRLLPKQFAEAWNSYFSSTIKVDVNAFENFMRINQKTGSRRESEALLTSFIRQSERNRLGGRIGPIRNFFLKRRIRKNIEMLQKLREGLIENERKMAA